MNKWKVAFFILVGLIVLAVVYIFYLATAPTDQVPRPVAQKAEGNVLVVQTTANEFESIAKQYLEDEIDKTPLPVEIEINESIQLFSTLTVFAVDVPISMDFDPIVEDGNIVLKQTEVNVGKLNIPPKTVLKLMEDSIKFPSWITIMPNDEEIYVDVSRLKIASGSRVRAKEIDLANDKILLEVILTID